jgi:hypothetical protein
VWQCGQHPWPLPGYAQSGSWEAAGEGGGDIVREFNTLEAARNGEMGHSLVLVAVRK